MARKSVIKKYFSRLAKRSHKKHPRGKEFYQMMARARWDKQKLSTSRTCDGQKNEV